MTIQFLPQCCAEEFAELRRGSGYWLYIAHSVSQTCPTCPADRTSYFEFGVSPHLPAAFARLTNFWFMDGIAECGLRSVTSWILDFKIVKNIPDNPIGYSNFSSTFTSSKSCSRPLAFLFLMSSFLPIT